MRKPVVVMMMAAGLTAARCTSDNGPSDTTTALSADMPYRFDQPDTSFALPEELLEISGLTALDNHRLAAVQDEDGIVFLIDAATGSITSRIAFGDGGDYEGIDWTGEHLFVLRSNGNLTELTGWEQGEPEVRVHKTHLTKHNDMEGLAHDPAGGRVLIVTKEQPGAGLDEEEQKAIYGFDPDTGNLTEEPVIVVDLSEIRDAVPGLVRFSPSALAVHPNSGAIYVLSATEQALVALHPEGELRHAWRLDKELFEKPEGLAFTPSGDLYVSGEGVDGPPMLFRYAEQRKIAAE